MQSNFPKNRNSRHFHFSRYPLRWLEVSRPEPVHIVLHHTYYYDYVHNRDGCPPVNWSSLNIEFASIGNGSHNRVQYAIFVPKFV